MMLGSGVLVVMMVVMMIVMCGEMVVGAGSRCDDGRGASRPHPRLRQQSSTTSTSSTSPVPSFPTPRSLRQRRCRASIREWSCVARDIGHTMGAAHSGGCRTH